MLFTTVGDAEAQRGCCSWHGGISHCAANGRYVCNDGTYSPSCTCGAPRYTYTPPVPTIPLTTNATTEYIENSSGGVDLHFDWDRPEGRGYSITLNKSAGANPGPLSDTTKSEYVFKNVTPGTWYINLKEIIDGQWSEVVYWKIEIPTNVKSQAKPLSSPSPKISPTNQPESKKNSGDDSMNVITALMIGVGVPSFIAYMGKNK